MSINKFAAISKDLCMQIRIIEELLKCKSYIEADALMPKATKSCRTLESLMTEENKIQTHIVENRQKEISWIQDTLKDNLKKTPSKPVKKRDVNLKKK